MSNGKEKDPRRQWQGKVSRAKGNSFESRLDAACEYYKEKGFADIEKTPEPMHIIRSLGNGQFVACFKKKAQPDYKGTLKGGRSVMFEAKYTSSDRMQQSRVSKGQADYMDGQEKLGARCYVIAGFDSGEVYRIPWSVWKDMKQCFGRKYVKETDLNDYRVKTAWNGTLMILG